jgi:hypothetical protein
MAVRQPFQQDFLALRVNELRNRAACNYRSDGTYGDAGIPRSLRERLDAILR